MTKPTVFKKILLAMLLLALLPLVASSLIITLNLGDVRQRLADTIAESADRQAAESLRLQAEQAAHGVTDLLKECEADLRLLAHAPRNRRFLKLFYDSHRGEIWYRSGTADNPREVHEWIPRYSSLSIIDAKGRETFVIRSGRVLPPDELRDVSIPANTEFKSEEYFTRTRKLRQGEVYVSHLTGFHLSREEQLAGAREPEEAFGGKSYQGVIRFATPLFDVWGRFSGIIVLSLDQRHLMEFSQHIIPGKNSRTVFPSYRSGNYAFIFDDEGWAITHPKYWNIRGVDRSGRLVPPYTKDSTKGDIDSGRIPFSLDHAGFVHPNYPEASRLAREKRSGSLDVTTIGKTTKLMAFAPILYGTGDYARHGIFGAVTIGYEVRQFREMARAGAALINRQLREHLWLSGLILAVTSLLVVSCSWVLSRSIIKPLAILANGARQIASGDICRRVEVTGRDEVAELAEDFNRMTESLCVRLRASELMSRTLDLQVISDELLDLMVKGFRLDLAAIRLADREGRLLIRSHRGPPARILVETEWEPVEGPSIAVAFRSNAAQWVNGARESIQPAVQEMAAREGIRSYAHIPIACSGEPPVGILSVFSQSFPGLFTEPVQHLLASLTGQLAQVVKIVSEMEAKEEERRQKEAAHLKNARVERDLEIARQIQSSFLPSVPPELPGAAVACRCVPAAHVGGDYYDFFTRSGNTLDIVVADVSGHSVGAALVMAETRSVLQAVVRAAEPPGEILATLNNLLYEDLTRAELFITLFYLHYDPVSRTVVYANAGHNPPLVLRDGIPACTELDADGLILGVKKAVSFEEKVFELQQGDILVLYTDGITEAQNEKGELFGTRRLCEATAMNRTKPPGEIIDAVLDDVRGFSGSASLEDDISLVVIQVR